MSDPKADATLAARLRVRPAATAAPASPSSPPLHETIGAYRLIRLLGEGGMGSVFLAEQQEPVRRNVALKLMRSSLKGNVATARFSAERQALARLTHPNIAAIYDAGTTDEGFPFFVMEYIDGETLGAYCDALRLPLRTRLELFVQICEAVQHAHQRGIIHRDLKPWNVVVTTIDGRAVPKIIDFGIAKAVDQPLTDSTLWTGDGIVGTPAYMSPEALSGAGDDLDTRADVYSLGVLLYELLAGVRPRATEGVPLAMLIRDSLEAELPKLTARFKALPSDEKQRIAETRDLDPDLLHGRLRGDLTWIVAKATARERDARYSSAADLARDITRHLRDEPVSAGPPSAMYRARKFIRRHRAFAVAAATILATMVAAIVATTTAYVRAERARSEAEAMSQFLSDLISGANPWNTRRETTVRELLDEAARTAPVQLKEYPAAQSTLLVNIGTSLFHLGRSDRAEPLLRESLRLRREVYGDHHPLVARVLNILGLVRRELGDLEDAERLLRESVAIRQAAFGREHSAVAGGMFDLSSVLLSAGKAEEAERLCREVLTTRRKLQAEGDPEVSLNTVAMTLGQLSEIVAARGKYDEAESLLHEALRVRQREGVQGYGYARTEEMMGDLVSGRGRFEEGLKLYESSLGRLEEFVDPTDLRIVAMQTKIAESLGKLGRDAEAEAMYETAKQGLAKSSGHPFAIAEVRQLLDASYAGFAKQRRASDLSR